MPAEDDEGRRKLAGYMLRARMSFEKMTYDAATGMVIYRSKMHLGLKRNFQVMPDTEWLALLCKHIPDRPGSADRTVGHARAAPIGRTERRSGIAAALHWHRRLV